jgi:glycosyltransferase involved in cell wall biosynthesis
VSHRALRVALYSDAEVIGGAERSMFNLIQAYSGPCRLEVVSPSAVLLAEAERLAPATPRHHITSASGGPPGWRDHRSAFRGLHLDLLQVTLSNPFESRAAIIGGWTARVPTVAVEQLVLPSRRRRGAWSKCVQSQLYAAHVAVGDASADDLSRLFHLRRSSISVVHNGVPEVDVEPIRHAPAPVVGSAARLEDQKHLELLVDALRRVPTAHLVLVGDGSRRDDLERRAAERGVADRVRFVGWVDDARPHIGGFDVFALPSRAESFPLSIVEAMLQGIPVVASDVGSVGDAVIDGVTGLLVPPGDGEALGEALERLLTDEALASRLARAAQRRAQVRFTDAAMAATYDRLWASVLSARSARWFRRS